MRKDWKYRQIGEIMKVERGGSPRPITKYITESPDGINWIKIGDATASDKYIYETKQKIIEEGINKSRLVEAGDLLLSNSMSFGKPYILKTRGCIHDGWLVLKAKDVNELDNEFLYHLLGSPNVFKQFDKLAAGSTVRNLNIKLVSSVKIPIPPFSEQKQIVALLDKAFAAIDQAKANIEKNIQNARELFQSKLDEVFGKNPENWEQKRLGDLCKYDKTKYSGKNLPYVGLEHIESNTGYYLGDLKPVNVKSATFHFSEKHLLYGRLRPYLNKVLVPNFEGHCSTEIFPILCNGNVDRNYLFYWFISPKTVEKINKTSTGARMPRANMSEVINFKLPQPPLEIQKQISSELGSLRIKIRNIEERFNQKVILIEELKKSILEKAFKGELTVSNRDFEDVLDGFDYGDESKSEDL